MVVKGVNIPDKWIDATTELLDCSIAEAVDIYLSDLGKTENAEQKALNDKAKSVKIKHGAESEKERKKVERKREPNELKRAIIYTLLHSIASMPEVENATMTNIEKYIDFSVGDRSFTINLVEHRKKKKA